VEVSRSTEIKVGLVTIIGLALLIFGIMLGKGMSIGGAERNLLIRLPVSGGLESGSPVVVNGVKRGSIVAVRNDNGSVIAEAALDDVTDLKSDASALVTMLEITGGKKVEITSGTATSPFNLSQEMPGRVASDIGGMVTALGDVSGDAKNLVRRLDTIAASLTSLLADGQVVENVRTITTDGAILVTDAKNLLAENRKAITDVVRNAGLLVDEIRTIVQDTDPKLSKLLADLDGTVSEARTTLSKADNAIVHADTLIVQISDVVRAVRDGDGFANRVIYDTAFANRLDSTINSLTVFIRQAHRYGINVNVGLGQRP